MSVEADLRWMVELADGMAERLDYFEFVMHEGLPMLAQAPELLDPAPTPDETRHNLDRLSADMDRVEEVWQRLDDQGVRLPYRTGAILSRFLDLMEDLHERFEKEIAADQMPDVLAGLESLLADADDEDGDSR